MPALPPDLLPLDDDLLRRRAGERSFNLGVEYHEFGAVGRLDAAATTTRWTGSHAGWPRSRTAPTPAYAKRRSRSTGAEGGCRAHTWLTLADGRRAVDPAGALAVYARRVEQRVEARDKRSYPDAARIVTEHVRPTFATIGGEAAYRAWVGELRARHRRKRNLMALLPGLP